MDFRDSTHSDQSRRQQPRWGMIALIVGSVLLIAVLEHLSSSDGPFTRPFPSSVPAMPDGQRSAESNGSTSDDWVSKSRVLRSDRAAEEADRRAPRVAVAPKSSQKSAGASESASDRDGALLVHNVIVLDEDRRVVYRGDVDLGPTLKRIERGERLRFSHDGIIFENRERRLPTKQSGYYREYVQPTAGVGGPGAQRVVIGAEGEVFYSSDHYRSFRRIR